MLRKFRYIDIWLKPRLLRAVVDTTPRDISTVIIVGWEIQFIHLNVSSDIDVKKPNKKVKSVENKKSGWKKHEYLSTWSIMAAFTRRAICVGVISDHSAIRTTSLTLGRASNPHHRIASLRSTHFQLLWSEFALPELSTSCKYRSYFN